MGQVLAWAIVAALVLGLVLLVGLGPTGYALWRRAPSISGGPAHSWDLQLEVTPRGRR